MRLVGSFVTSIALLARVLLDSAPTQGPFDTARIEALTGAKGTLGEKGAVFKVSVPRWDLKVTAAGVHLTPSMGLVSWAAFKRAGNRTAVAGDLVLTEDQVNPVMSVALDRGLAVTGLHDQFFWDTPRVIFMHFTGSGTEEDLANEVGAVFTAIRTTAGGKGDVPRADIDPAKSTLDPKKLDAVFAGHGGPGEYKDGVYRVIVARATKSGSHPGVNSWAALVGSDDKAVIEGDFALLEPDLQDVLQTLRKRGINIVAIHQHMSGETIRALSLDYWGVGRAADLAAAMVSALGQTKHDAAP